jgi:hypothetical protein
VTPAEEALRDAFLAECWAPVREVPADVRAGWAAVAADRNARLDETRGASVERKSA